MTGSQKKENKRNRQIKIKKKKSVCMRIAKQKEHKRIKQLRDSIQWQIHGSHQIATTTTVKQLPHHHAAPPCCNLLIVYAICSRLLAIAAAALLWCPPRAASAPYEARRASLGVAIVRNGSTPLVCMLIFYYIVACNLRLRMCAT